MIRCTPPQLPGQAHIPLRRTSPPFPAGNPPSPWFQLRASSSEVAETAALAARDGFRESRSRSRPDPLFDAARKGSDILRAGLSGCIRQAAQAARTRMDAASSSCLPASRATNTANRLSSQSSKSGLGLSCASWLARHFFVYGMSSLFASSSRAATSVSAWQTCTPPEGNRSEAGARGNERGKECAWMRGAACRAWAACRAGLRRA